MVHLKDSIERLHGLEFVFIELEKFKARNITEKKMQVLWLRFMTEINENTEQIPQELLEQPEIQKAITFVMEASLSKAEKELYEKNWDRISSEKTLLSAALAEGEARSRKEIALKAKQMGMPTEDIARLTGFSLDEIGKLEL